MNKEKIYKNRKYKQVCRKETKLQTTEIQLEATQALRTEHTVTFKDVFCLECYNCDTGLLEGEKGGHG